MGKSLGKSWILGEGTLAWISFKMLSTLSKQRKTVDRKAKAATNGQGLGTGSIDAVTKCYQITSHV